MNIRQQILSMEGYTPGEQPSQFDLWTKLNTNENPYPPSSSCQDVIQKLDIARLRLYPNASSQSLRECIAQTFKFHQDQILVGNGSDDILNIVMRAFAGENETIATITPSYSLYSVLASLQSAKTLMIPLTTNFEIPSDLAEQANQANAKLLLIPRPNAPTGNAFPLDTIKQLCQQFNGTILIDEAYADFSEDNVLPLINQFPNLMVSRTLSKSYALAGLRVGFLITNSKIIYELNKIKDSYNVGMLPQLIAEAAIKDQEYLKTTVKKIIHTRKETIVKLQKLGFFTVPSQSNFIFAKPPDEDGKRCYEELKKRHLLVRYFSMENTCKFVRITVGTDEQMDRLINALSEIYKS